MKKCCECNEEAKWVYNGQFTGDLYFCLEHAMKNGLYKGLLTPNSHGYWSKLDDVMYWPNDFDGAH